MSLIQKNGTDTVTSTGDIYTNGTGDHQHNSNEFIFDKSSLLLNSVASGIAYVDKDLQVQFANKAFAKIIGIELKQIQGKMIQEVWGPEANEIVKKYRETALAGKPSSFELDLPLQNGNCYIGATYTPEWDKEGNVAGYVLVINDISQQRNATRALQESEKKYKEVVESLPIALYTCDKRGYITLSNEAAHDLWGRKPQYGKEQWCGSWKIFQMDGVSELELDTCPMAIAIKEGRPVYGKEIIIERPNRTRRYVQPHPTPLFDIDGNVSGAVNVLLDITDRKQAEKGSAQLAAIVHSSFDPIISKTLDGVITSWNEAAEKLFGYSSEEMIGQPITRLIPADRRNEETLILERLKRGEKVEHFETKRIGKDNKELDLSLTISPVKDESGNVIGASKIARDITAQKKLFEIVRESEQRLRMAIESTHLGTWELTPSSGVIECSDECRKIFGFPLDMDADYDLFTKQIHPEDSEWVNYKIAEALNPSSEGKYDIKYRLIHYKDKQSRWVRAQGQAYFNDEGKPERFIGTILDITEEKKYELALKANIELFTTMVDNVPAMIWMSGNDKFSDFFNKTWLAFTGRTLEKESKEGWLENVHPDDVQRCIEGYNKAFNEQKGLYSEYRLKRYDGEYRWIADNSVPRYDPDGTFAGFISACIDIDDQKNFREKILKSELLLKTISNVAPVGLWMTDINTRNTFVNDTWIEWTGIPMEKQVGSGWMNCLLEEDRMNALGKFSESLLKKERYSTEFRIRRPNGELMWCLTEGSPYYHVDGTFAGYAGSVTDITELKNVEKRKDDFIKMASHELKTPITSIKGYVQLLLNIYEELDEQRFQAARGTVRSSLHTIAKQVTKLTRLVTELLDMSRIESGKLELHKTSFDLALLVEETVQDVRQITSRHAIIVNNDFEGSVFADKDRISQVLLNLLTNAIKYSPDADCVEIYTERQGKKALIKVKDKGIGIDKKDHENIFQRFYRVEGKSEQTYPGFGIGLFIASEIVQRHNGTMSVQSEKGKGSIFTVELPVGI